MLCTLSAIVMGLIIAITAVKCSRCSQSFAVTLVVLPVIVQVVIMLVNGNVGTGVAVAGTFSLVRFRSVPGSARDIVIIFLAMAVGLACGVGQVGVALIACVISCAILMVFTKVRFFSDSDKRLLITIPENLDYSTVFDDLFSVYASHVELVNVKTTNMGSLYKLEYRLTLKDAAKEKEMIDKLRCRNGNLEISCGRPVTADQL